MALAVRWGVEPLHARQKLDFKRGSCGLPWVKTTKRPVWSHASSRGRSDMTRRTLGALEARTAFDTIECPVFLSSQSALRTAAPTAESYTQWAVFECRRVASDAFRPLKHPVYSVQFGQFK